MLVVGCGADGINVQTTLWLSREYPAASVIARSSCRSGFAADAAKETGVLAFSVADLIQRRIPDEWLGEG